MRLITRDSGQGTFGLAGFVGAPVLMTALVAVAMALGVASPAHAAPKVPGQPTAVNAAPGNAKATVVWKAPKSTGGKTITGYIVTSSPGAKQCTTKGALTCTVSGLTNGKAYTFKVVAKNSVGKGIPSKASAPVVPFTVPGTPTAVVASAGDQQATVSWSAPKSNGGAAITNYVATSSPDAKTCTTNGGLICTVTGLKNGTTYTFTVRAKNSAGLSPTSAPSNGVSPAAPALLGVGYFHNCAVVGGAVKCWGSNTLGQLGNGSKEGSSTPVTVPGISNAVAVGVGGSHTCALLATQLVECWGNGQQGQLGNGSNDQSDVPVDVSGITGVTAIAIGENHGCALLAGGTVKCWGGGWYGQLGNGAKPNQNIPVTVSLAEKAISISARGDHSCAVIQSGGVRCWGSNSYGELGNNANSDGEPLPQAVVGVTSAASVSAGDHHTCAALKDGTAVCWGQNTQGQLGRGIGDFSTSFVPVQVKGLATVKGVTAGFEHSCAWLTNGTVQCWGGNNSYQLGRGQGAGTQDTDTAAAVLTINTAKLVGAGRYYTCAELDSGTVQCWGANVSGVLGNDSPFAAPEPVTVAGL